MPRGDPDPRANAAPIEELPRLLAAGAAHLNAGRWWHAHEDWEAAWHSLRAAGRPADADAVQGLILVAAGLENAARGKTDGFRRQAAKGVAALRAAVHRLPALGLADARAWVDAMTDAYLEGAGVHDVAEWRPRAPELRFR